MMAQETSRQSKKFAERGLSVGRLGRSPLLCLLIGCGTLISVAGNAQSTPVVPLTHVWKASWITSPDAPQRDECFLHFRKEINLASQPDRFAIYVSADNQYLLKVNGKNVGTGPSHGDIQHWKYTTYDIASLLHPGSNVISATVWNFGENAPVRQITDRIGFLIDGDSSKPGRYSLGPNLERRNREGTFNARDPTGNAEALLRWLACRETGRCYLQLGMG
jgi:alpha-L-rhamnosidase